MIGSCRIWDGNYQCREPRWEQTIPGLRAQTPPKTQKLATPVVQVRFDDEYGAPKVRMAIVVQLVF